MVAIERRGTAAIVSIDNPPVNAVSGEILGEVTAALEEVLAEPEINGIVLTGTGRAFVAGADIKMLSDVVGGKLPLPDLNTCLTLLERSLKPTVSAICGPALGGGLEIAMATHYRLASPDAILGQPEAKLGLIPGMGGTQRLPRLVGMEKALEMCVLGEPISASDALKIGLVDEVVEGDLLTAAIKFLHGIHPRRTCDMACSAPAQLFDEWRARARRVKRGEEAPLTAVEAIKAAQLPFAAGFAREQELFLERLGSKQAAAMMHVFFGERAVAKIPGLRADIHPKMIKRAAVLGAGFMGSGISMALANAGIPVRLTDVSGDAIDRAFASIQKRCENSGLVDARPGFDGFEQVDLIIEAVVESLPVKQEAFGQLARVANPDCILATNTSTLDIDEIARVTDREKTFIGLHFFSPAHVMRLLEVVRGGNTNDETIASAMALGKRLGKIPVLARNEFGFIGNRMILPYLREAHLLVEEGVAVEQINRALYDFGMPMGPLAMEDLVGLDVTYFMRQEASRRGHLTGPQPRVADLLYRSGRYGQKAGIGWCKYDSNRKASPNPEITDLFGGSQRKISDEAIVLRCLRALVEEGRALLRDGVALRPVDVDVVFVCGFGFPPWRGGPLFWAGRNPVKIDSPAE